MSYYGSDTFFLHDLGYRYVRKGCRCHEIIYVERNGDADMAACCAGHMSGQKRKKAQGKCSCAFSNNILVILCHYSSSNRNCAVSSAELNCMPSRSGASPRSARRAFASDSVQRGWPSASVAAVIAAMTSCLYFSSSSIIMLLCRISIQE